MEETGINTIILGKETIEAKEDGTVHVNGKPISSMADLELALNMLNRAIIVVAGGNPTIHTGGEIH